jgi:glycerophosphoryl diester phosphodiesterase
LTVAIAHRGDPEVARENTMASFLSAAAAGADMIEIDLRRSADGGIVIVHDATLTRLWGVDRAVADLTLAELADIGDGDMRIPTLAEVLDIIELPLMVDFTRTDVVEGALALVLAAGALDRALFVTRNVDALRHLRALASDARLGISWIEPEPPSQALLTELDAECWNPWFGLADPDNVAAVHGLGRQVSVWTVDEPEDLVAVTALGVDAIVSNRISALRDFLS